MTRNVIRLDAGAQVEDKALRVAEQAHDEALRTATEAADTEVKRAEAIRAATGPASCYETTSPWVWLALRCQRRLR